MLRNGHAKSADSILSVYIKEGGLLPDYASLFLLKAKSEYLGSDLIEDYSGFFFDSSISDFLKKKGSAFLDTAYILNKKEEIPPTVLKSVLKYSSGDEASVRILGVLTDYYDGKKDEDSALYYSEKIITEYPEKTGPEYLEIYEKYLPEEEAVRGALAEARYLLARKKYAASETAARHLMREKSCRKNAYDILIEIFYESGKYDSCFVYAEGKLKDFPGDKNALLYISRCRMKEADDRGYENASGEYIKRFPYSYISRQMLMINAQNAEKAGDYKRAVKYYNRASSVIRWRRYREEYLFRRALCFYKMQAENQAVSDFRFLLKRCSDIKDSIPVLYWLGKSYLLQKKTHKAKECFSLLYHREPFSFYAALSEKYLQSNFSKFPQGPPLEHPENETSVLKRMPGYEKPDTTTDTPVLRGRFRTLLESGLVEYAYREADTLFSIHDKDYPFFAQMSRLFREKGAWFESAVSGIKLLYRLNKENVADIPDFVRRAAYPAPPSYLEFISEKTKDKDKPEKLWYISLIRQESCFMDRVVSFAGAVGLMQVMPETGREIAENLGDKNYSPDSLKNPEFNIRYGTYYLYKMFEKFGGNICCALASYNAGPHRVEKWLKENPGKPDDLFVEDIPFRETKNYVKSVISHYRNYTYLYGRQGR